jgi:hypothetical protein
MGFVGGCIGGLVVGCSSDEVEEYCVKCSVCVIMAAWTLDGVGVVIGSSRHRPNQPGVSQLIVVVVVVFFVLEEVKVVVVAVDSSKQPHQPGVLQVDVRVLVFVADVVVVRLVVGKELLLS